MCKLLYSPSLLPSLNWPGIHWRLWLHICVISSVITHADESRRSKAFICVCVFASVCLCLFVWMMEPKRLKLQSPNLPDIVRHGHPLNIRSEGQDHRVTKCKNIFQTIEWLAWVCTLSSGLRLVVIANYKYEYECALCRWSVVIVILLGDLACKVHCSCVMMVFCHFWTFVSFMWVAVLLTGLVRLYILGILLILNDIAHRRCTFVKQVNNVLCSFPTLGTNVRYKLFRSYCTSIFGCELWHLNNVNIDKFCTSCLLYTSPSPRD